MSGTRGYEAAWPARDVSGAAESPVGDAVPVPDELFARVMRELGRLADLCDVPPAETLPLTGTCHQGPCSVPVPRSPRSLAELGLPESVIAEQLLKQLYLLGPRDSQSLALDLRLPLPLVEELLPGLLDQQLVDRGCGTDIASLVRLTPIGHQQAVRALEKSRYTGPVPVSLVEYARQCVAQSLRYAVPQPRLLRESLGSLVLSQELVERLGVAITSGHSLLLTGPAGNGKSAIIERLAEYVSRLEDIFIPVAVWQGGHSIPVFDPHLHQCVETNAADWDARWRKIRRPCLSITVQSTAIPFSVTKANGGLVVLDNLGRYPLPANWFTNWSMMLETRQFSQSTSSSTVETNWPAECLLIAITHEQPSTLLSAPDLRRLRHMLPIERPNLLAYQQILQKCAQDTGVSLPPHMGERLFQACLDRHKLPDASDPQDFLNHVQAYCRFHELSPSFSEEVLMAVLDQRWPQSLRKAAG